MCAILLYCVYVLLLSLQLIIYQFHVKPTCTFHLVRHYYCLVMMIKILSLVVTEMGVNPMTLEVLKIWCLSSGLCNDDVEKALKINWKTQWWNLNKNVLKMKWKTQRLNLKKTFLLRTLSSENMLKIKWKIQWWNLKKIFLLRT